MESKENSGLALVCDLQGLTQRVILDGLGLMQQGLVTASFLELTDEGNREKAALFLDALQSVGVAVDWEINVLLNGMLVPLHWAGCKDKSFLVVLVALTRRDLRLMMESLRCSNCEFSDAMGRLAMKAIPLFEDRIKHDSHIFDELTSLNNELTALHRTLAKQKAELERLNELKNQFLGMAAHDLRKPAGVILTYTEFVLNEAENVLTAEQKAFLRTSIKAAVGMKQIIDSFLNIAVIESGKLHLELVPVSAAEIIDSSVEICRLQAAIKKVHLIVEATDGIRRFKADASKLQQVLVNLVCNAIEYSQEGRRVWLSSCWNEREVIFAVRDEGAGLSPEDKAQIFVSFVHAGTRKTVGERAIGLGLQIAQRIVDAHKGRLWVDSELGKGTTFFLSVPVAFGKAL